MTVALWILIAVGYNYAGYVTTQEFFNKSSCETAKTEIERLWQEQQGWAEVRNQAICVPK